MASVRPLSIPGKPHDCRATHISGLDRPPTEGQPKGVGPTFDAWVNSPRSKNACSVRWCHEPRAFIQADLAQRVLKVYFPTIVESYIRYGRLNVAKIPFERSSGNVFADMGFAPAEVAELTAKSRLTIAIKDTIEQHKLTQQEAARLCDTDQPTLSKVFRGRMESVTIDRLASWLNALGPDRQSVPAQAPALR